LRTTNLAFGFNRCENGLYQAMEKPLFLLASAVLLACPASSFAARQAWQVHHQTGAFGEATTMAAFADADSGPGQMNLYCDTRDGFRVMFSPHRLAMTEGTGHIIMAIDGQAPVTLTANAFGDDTTDVVTVYEADRIENALAAATHVTVKFIGYDNTTSQSAFTFDGLAAEKHTLLKICPVSRP
jgi:hypothetical protein